MVKNSFYNVLAWYFIYHFVISNFIMWLSSTVRTSYTVVSFCHRILARSGDTRERALVRHKTREAFCRLDQWKLESGGRAELSEENTLLPLNAITNFTSIIVKQSRRRDGRILKPLLLKKMCWMG
jgi:hypothetical protein